MQFPAILDALHGNRVVPSVLNLVGRQRRQWDVEVGNRIVFSDFVGTLQVQLENLGLYIRDRKAEILSPERNERSLLRRRSLPSAARAEVETHVGIRLPETIHLRNVLCFDDANLKLQRHRPDWCLIVPAVSELPQLSVILSSFFTERLFVVRVDPPADRRSLPETRKFRVNISRINPPNYTNSDMRLNRSGPTRREFS
jgi:hypothetical protein